MTFPPHSSAAFFEAKYQQTADPWDFESSEYEHRRYDAILTSLGDRHYQSALEPGCSVGVLTQGLAPLCERLLALDFSATAVAKAKLRCREFAHVEVACMGIQEIDSFATYDLIVLSEIGYYFSETQWKTLSQRIAEEMPPGAILLAAHWTGHSEDHEISGDLVHEILLSNPHLSLQSSEIHTGFRLNRWARL